MELPPNTYLKNNLWPTIAFSTLGTTAQVHNDQNKLVLGCTMLADPRLYSKVWPMLSIFDSNKQKTPLEISVVFWPVHLVWMTARHQQDTFLSWHLAPASEVAGGHTLPF
jgi:hypothetical protein